MDLREGSLIYGGFTRRISDRRRMDPLLFNVLAGVLSSLVFLAGMRGLVLHWEWFKWLCTKCRIRRSSRGVITQASQLVAEVQADALLLRFAPVVSVISRCVWISLSKLRRLVVNSVNGSLSISIREPFATDFGVSWLPSFRSFISQVARPDMISCCLFDLCMKSLLLEN